MTCKPPRPAPPAPEAVAQALDLLLKAMEESDPASSEEGLAIASGMAHLDRLAWHHQVAGEALQHAAQTRAALIRRQRNAFTPFNRLPSEVVSAILIETVDENQPHRIKALQVLAQVAWQWWQTIKSDPHFWAYIAPPMEDVELQIRKAGILPLRLYWRISEDLDALEDLLQLHIGRWTSIDLRGLGSFGLQLLHTIHFPVLKYLKFDTNSRGTEGLRFNIAQCPNLEEAHLPIMPYLPTSLSSNSPLPLQILHLVLHPEHSYSSSDIESLLRLTPQLIELKVKRLYHDTSPPPSHDAPIIDLPMLRRLEFVNALSGEERDWIPVLAQIRSPQLEELDLDYAFGKERQIEITRQTFLNALVGWSVLSLNRPSDAPLHSVLRNAGPSASWRVELSDGLIRIKAMGTGNGRLDVLMDVGFLSGEHFPSYILPPPILFPLPVDLSVDWWDGIGRPEFWDKVLDATPSLRSVTLASPLYLAERIMDRLSINAPSSSPASPRAPTLEKLRFISDPSGIMETWSEGHEKEAVKTMLDKRRDIFIQGGVLDPPKLAVTGPNGRLFDEAEGCWLGFESSDA